MSTPAPRAQHVAPGTGQPGRTARVAHHIPGRLRMVIAAARSDMGYLVRVAEKIEGLAGVEAVDVSPRTGSLVVHYEPNRHHLIADALLDLGGAEHLFELEPEASDPQGAGRAQIDAPGSQVARTLLALAQVVDRELKVATNGVVDLRLLLPLGAAGASAASARTAASGATPLWLTLAIFAFSSFDALHRGVANSNAPSRR